ncbi:RHS repeat-associated core domain-containing protein, partial [Pseudovibrio denitrificans]|uniref:RHS repeat-associated core domain-containing protein n=1 Tax=Pseudovibrio denitrificans TaxID=258256 RepID=UPI001ABFAB28
VGRISKIRSNRANGNWDYTYDSINQLTAATNVGNSALTRSFTYSPSGNLLSKSDVGTYSYPAPTAARPHAPTKAGSWTFSYDGNGNMVSGKGRSLVYDGKDRPISVTMGGVTTQYVYGPDDKRLKKISGGQTTLYLGDDEEILPDGTVIKHLDGSVRRVGTTTNWLHRDHMSSVRMLTNNTGSIAAVSRYQPYGKRTDVQQAADTPRESKGWIGERDDPETGLTYLNARYYDADLARFIQSDWLGPTDPYVGSNRYSYALNNPITFKDPSGHRIDDFNEIGSKGVTSGARNQDEYREFRNARDRHGRSSSERRSYDYSDYRDEGYDYGHTYDRYDYGDRSYIERGRRSTDQVIVEATFEAINTYAPVVSTVNEVLAAQTPADYVSAAAGAVPIAKAFKLVKAGVAGGTRAGKSFTKKTKQAIDAENAAMFAGDNVCVKCGVKVVPGKQSQKGVTPPDNEKHRDHIIAKSQGGDGTLENGQILCRKCNLNKGAK